MPINWTVTHDQTASADDTLDVGSDADEVALIGPVRFIPQFRDDRPLLAPNASPRPKGFKIREFTGYLDDDGQLKNRPGGTVGVRLWANDPIFGIEPSVGLWYEVLFNVTTPAGEPVKLAGGYIKAPETDVSMSLAEMLQTTGSTGLGITRGAPGDDGFPVSFVDLNGDGDVVFYVNGAPIDNPLHLEVIDMSSVDGGTPSDPGDTILDGGAP